MAGNSKKIDENLRKQLTHTYRFSNHDIKFILLLQKYVYPYKYINYWEKLNETLLTEMVLSLFANGQRGVATLSNLKRNNSCRTSQRNMRLSLSKWDHNYSRLLPRGSQSRTRFRVPLSVVFKQMEVKSNNFEVNFLGSLNARQCV